jgi:hypothetical protein
VPTDGNLSTLRRRQLIKTVSSKIALALKNRAFKTGIAAKLADFKRDKFFF